MGLALLVRLLIAPVNAGLQYVTFFPAVTLAAIICGYRAGLLATLIGLVFATYIFTPPYYSISIEVLQTSFWSNIVFLTDGIIISFSIEAMHRYRQKYQQELKESKQSEANAVKLNEKLEKQIAERKKTELALVEAMHELEIKELSSTRFLAAAGHDLRQPLAAANLFINALQCTESTPQQNLIIQRLDQTMIIFNGLLDALLNISKLDSGVIKPEYALVDVTNVFDRLEQSFVPMAREKQIGFKLYLPIKGALVVRTDFGLLNSILANLVSNAIKFTSRGAILISARKRGNDVLFQVWDTGMGISDEHIRHIFDEFYQVSNPQRDRSNGLGLGLAIAKRAIKLLGSEIRCRSQTGKGTVFEFRLPLDFTSSGVGQQAASEASQEDVANLSFVQGKRFAVVEDDILVAQALTQSLEGIGGEVQCFHNAEDALQHANTVCADYHIVGYMLSGTLDGIQYLNLLRQKLGKPVNAVLMTGDTSSNLIRKTANCDWPVFFKPVSMFKLISNFEKKGKHV
jgi:signal transduction histidine kinase